MNNFDYIKKFLHDNSITERHPLSLPRPLKCYFEFESEDSTFHSFINAKYLYIKCDTPFVANEKYDEVSIDLLSENDTYKIACIFRMLNEKLAKK